MSPCVYSATTLDELERLTAENLWNKPSAGFFTYGETGRGNTGICDFHQFALSVVLIKEK